MTPHPHTSHPRVPMTGPGVHPACQETAPDPSVEPLDPFAPHCPQDLPCRVHDRYLWFGARPAELETAKQLCRSCPARPGCLAGAIERREPWGVWGGEIFDKGTIIACKRPRGRPRNTNREEAA